MYFLIGLVLLSIASYIDVKTKTVPYFLSYFMIGAGIILQSIKSIEYGINHIMIISVYTFVVFLFGYLRFKAGQWGGGDAVILLGAIYYLIDPKNYLAPIEFIILSFFCGALYGIVYTVYRGIKAKINIKQEALIAMVGIAILVLTYQKGITSLLIGVLVAILCTIPLIKKVEEKAMIVYIPANKVVEGDWIVEPIKLKNITIRPKKTGLTEKEAEIIRRMYRQGKIKRIAVKDGVPFVPSFLIAYLIMVVLNLV